MTGLALTFILETSFRPESGSRPGVPKIGILITDGKSQDDVIPPARSLREAGIELFAIGVKGSDENGLKAIASPPEETHMYYVADFSVMNDIVESLTKRVCERVEQLDRQIKGGPMAKVRNDHMDVDKLVGGASRCEGTLEVKHQGEWRPVGYYRWNLKEAAESIRLVNGSGLCSGRLEVRSNQSNQWSSVCEEDFDQQGAEVVCRELGCGAPSVLQGALYGEVEAPMWTKGFQCGGHESALLDCRSSGSERNTCSPGKAVGLTCSEPVRLVGGASRCEGTLEVKHQGEWRPVDYHGWNLKGADVACRDLDCGSAVSIRHRKESSVRSVWWIHSDCVQSGSAVRECLWSGSTSYIVDLTCSAPGDAEVETCFFIRVKAHLLRCG
ncbi:scavenger receptor cysteine-rich type 1 protein M130-like [Pungitius pungitius]|uniref:scavenger receptor cysteine-rich type 1 protein M130-like n=1 Tax=Pungitius pungitius TaxID=134920 RepID=UPI002E16574C